MLLPSDGARSWPSPDGPDGPAVRARRAGVEPAGPPRVADLLGSLPWIGRWRDRVLLVELGPGLLDDPLLLPALAEDLVLLYYLGVKPVIVHGVDSHVRELAAKLTPDSVPAAGVLRMVLVGQVQRRLVGAIGAHGPFAMGLTGDDARLLTAVRRPADPVGELTGVDPRLLLCYLADRRIPVVSALARGDAGAVLQVDAHAATTALAAALGAPSPLLLTGTLPPHAVLHAVIGCD